MRKLYKPHYRGPGDGLLFHFFFGFQEMGEEDRRLVAEELPLVMDDIAGLIRLGYTVVLDTEATGVKLRQALYGEVPDVDGLRTVGVFWSSQGFEDGALGTWDGARLSPIHLQPERMDRLLRVLILACSWASTQTPQWQRACGPGCRVFAWDGHLDRGTRMRFLDAAQATGWGLSALLHHLVAPPPAAAAPPPSPAPAAPLPANEEDEDAIMTSAAPFQAPRRRQEEVITEHLPRVRDDARTQIFQAVSAAPAPLDVDPLDDARTRVLPAVRGPLNPEPTPAPQPAPQLAPTPSVGPRLAAAGAPRTGFSERFDGAPPDAPDEPPASSPPSGGEALAVVEDPKKPVDPVGNLANSVFQAFSGGRSLDQVVGEQLKKHKVLGGVASTVLPGLVSFAGKQAASRVQNASAQKVIQSAADAAQKILTPEEERAQAMVAAMQAPSTAEGAEDPDEAPPKTPKDVEQRLRRVAADFGGACTWHGAVLQIVVPLQDGRSHTVHARLIPDGEAAVLSLYSHVGVIAAEVDLRAGLRLTAQTYFARVSLVAGDAGDAILCQSTLPRLALTRSVLRVAVEELASVADGLEAWLFGHDVY